MVIVTATVCVAPLSFRIVYQIFGATGESPFARIAGGEVCTVPAPAKTNSASTPVPAVGFVVSVRVRSESRAACVA